MAVETTTVQGKVLKPDGTAAAGATLVIALTQAGRTLDGGVLKLIAPAPIYVVADSGGAVSFAIVPNDAIAPVTYYRVEVRPTDMPRWVEGWNLATTPDPMRRTSTRPGEPSSAPADGTARPGCTSPPDCARRGSN